MPKFFYWGIPLTLVFTISVFLKLSDSIIVWTFFMAFAGLFIELIRSIVIAKETPINKKIKATRNYYY